MYWKYKSNTDLFRLGSLLILQAVSAVLLYLTLFPPDRFAPAQQLQILTANVAKNAMQANSSLRVLALPEAPAGLAADRVPDMATVLRRFPNVKELEVLGDGVPMRDWHVAQGISIRYQAIPIEKGLIELSMPLPVVPGQPWAVNGRVAQANAIVELVDPSGKAIDSFSAGKTGVFTLTDTARGVGNALYQLRVLDAKKKILESINIPVITVAPQKLNLLSISGGVNPELKYMKRWALDADINLQSSVSLGLGMQIQSAPLVLNADSLRNVDLVIVDERAWMAMSVSEQQAIRSAVQSGMGVLLRLTGPLNNTVRSQWRALGFSIQDANVVQTVRLSEPNQLKKLPDLLRQSVKVSAADAVPLYVDSLNEALGLWRAYGLGRVGVWWLNESYRLVLAGNDDVYGAMWSEISSVLARAKLKASVQMPNQHMWANERAVFCDLADGAVVSSPEGKSEPLLLETQSANKNCAAFWPKQAGWHALNNARQSHMFYVRDNTDGMALHRRVIQQANIALTSTYKSTLSVSKVAVPGDSWPYFLAWLLFTSLLWYLERSKFGFSK
jgi:hypothetical protein